MAAAVMAVSSRMEGNARREAVKGVVVREKEDDGVLGNTRVEETDRTRVASFNVREAARSSEMEDTGVSRLL